MAAANALLVPNPHSTVVAVPITVEVDADGAAPEHLDYDGSPYRRTEGRGPEGEWLYELLE